MNLKEIEAAALMMKIFIGGLAFNFDANFHEFDEITKKIISRLKNVSWQPLKSSCRCRVEESKFLERNDLNPND